MQEVVVGNSHHEIKRLYEKFASSTNFIRLAKWFNDNFQKFCEWNKGYFLKCCFWNLFRIYLLMLKAMKSLFLCILLSENYCFKD